MGGSIAQTSRDSFPSFVTLPENTASPFGGVRPISFNFLVARSRALITFFRVPEDLMFVAVPFSSSSCFVVWVSVAPAGTMTVINSVCRPL